MEYLEVYPNSILFDVINGKTFTLSSYFNTGNSQRNISVKLEYVSGCNIAPIINYYSFSGSGNMSGVLTGGHGEITGRITGLYTGNSGILVSSYYTEYVFTGNYTGTATTTGSGLFSGSPVYGEIQSGYNVNLTSGDSGIISLGSGTGLLTRDVEFLSGRSSMNFTFGGTGEAESFYITGYTGYGNFNQSGNPNYFFDSTGISYYLCVYGVNLVDLSGVSFDIAKLRHYPTGTSGGYTESFDITSFSKIGYSNYSGIKSGSYIVYTGVIPSGGNPLSSDTIGLENFISGNNVSGTYLVYIASEPYTLPSSIWYIDQFSFTNMPVSSKTSYSITGTGFFQNIYATGNVNLFKYIDMNTGILEFPGQTGFSDVWNIKTGLSSNNNIDFKINNYFNTGAYEHSGNYAISNINTINDFYLSVSHNGENLSGNNIAKLIINDGILNREIILTGESEI